jgi:hypothetical protein
LADFEFQPLGHGHERDQSDAPGDFRIVAEANRVILEQEGHHVGTTTICVMRTGESACGRATRECVNLKTQGPAIMTVTLHLPPEKEAAFKAQADARGLSLEQWMLEAADQHVPPVSFAHLQKTNPEEWARHFDAWVNSHDPNTPVLSDEAMSRDSIYPDLI